MNNETLKLNHLRLELEDNEKETKAAGERLDHLKTITHHIVHLNDLNQQLECQYLRFTDEMPMAVHSQAITPHLPGDDDEQPPFKSTSSTTTNGRDETSDIDSISFNEEHRDEIDELHQAEDTQAENYDQLFAEIIDLLTNQSQWMKRGSFVSSAHWIQFI